MKHSGRGSRAPGPWITPWPRLMPWLVMLAGLVLGRWVGYSPSPFVAMAATCLLLGLLKSA